MRISGDGVPVVIHDETLDRVQERPERVDQLSADVLLDRGVPWLADVLAAVNHQAFLDIELKVEIGAPIVTILAAARGPALHQAAVSSFDHGALERVRQLAPEWPRWLNTKSLAAADIATAVDLGCRGIAVEWHALDARSIRAATDASLDVVAWTVRRKATFDRLARHGVTAVCVEAAALDG